MSVARSARMTTERHVGSVGTPSRRRAVRVVRTLLALALIAGIVLLSPIGSQFGAGKSGVAGAASA